MPTTKDVQSFNLHSVSMVLTCILLKVLYYLGNRLDDIVQHFEVKNVQQIFDDKLWPVRVARNEETMFELVNFR